jgi:GxxExxY protein
MEATGNELRLRALTEQVIGGFYDTYNALGHGFLEVVYENSLAVLLRERGLHVQTQIPIGVRFRGQIVGEFRADMLVEECLLIEIKAASNLAPIHEAQLLHYLKATGIQVGLLFNFGPRPQFRRRVFS